MYDVLTKLQNNISVIVVCWNVCNVLNNILLLKVKGN